MTKKTVIHMPNGEAVEITVDDVLNYHLNSRGTAIVTDPSRIEKIQAVSYYLQHGGAVDFSLKPMKVN